MTGDGDEGGPSKGSDTGDGEEATAPADHATADIASVLGESGPAYDRDDLARLLSDVVAEGVRKIRSGRVKSPENERVRLKYIRATAYAADRLNAVLTELEEHGEADPEASGDAADGDLLDGIDLDAVEAEGEDG